MLHLIKPKPIFHPQPAQHFKSKWQKGDKITVWYIVYQCLSCIFLLSSVIYTWTLQKDKPAESRWKYIIYLTHWGIVTLNATVLLETVLTLVVYCKQRTSGKVSSGLDRALHISWGMSHATYSCAVFITGLYWTLLYTGEDTTYTNIYQHALQGVYAVVDQLVSARPWEGGHWWVCPILPIVYVIFNVIFWAAGGTNDKGEDFVYPVLNWTENPGTSAGLIFGALLVLICIHYILVGLTHLRDKVHQQMFPQQHLV
ncbi:uncharacterized protein LOC111713920 [Eurytemora carolleeae]|uniref:uncharacterized protein LOC111713920 n=1 Tax=Eurytemora carolleeae TaxID=1294199 RepID=UPI000C787E3B|nr:uncharacterized protein LOC111713920 [Eurytemora carolleeae]|eukprot:XP_023344679.1 uncharacterized protein LOC111713920 [Eurytemora affinis]